MCILGTFGGHNICPKIPKVWVIFHPHFGCHGQMNWHPVQWSGRPGWLPQISVSAQGLEALARWAMHYGTLGRCRQMNRLPGQWGGCPGQTNWRPGQRDEQPGWWVAMDWANRRLAQKCSTCSKYFQILGRIGLIMCGLGKR